MGPESDVSNMVHCILLTMLTAARKSNNQCFIETFFFQNSTQLKIHKPAQPKSKVATTSQVRKATEL
jgi:hypothetical protein